MDHKDVWGSVELTPRFNVTMTCKQIQQEAETMLFANNTFLFKAQDRRVNYGVLGHAADWLETLEGKQRDSIASIVVCSKQLVRSSGRQCWIGLGSARVTSSWTSSEQMVRYCWRWKLLPAR